ncbi:MAG: BlaI/MecI/CopY family transcriptional regulator [Trueperaceae bacterium]|nr:BlaI/MecI/CopY family transcriptional regulator [Trueperaceae bacterium]
MPRPKQETPTDREMEILQVLWEKGSLSTRDIVEALNQGRRKKLAYTSVHTILSIMIKKGLITKGKDSESHILSPVHTKDDMEAKLIQRLKRNVFGGSTMRLVSRALSTHAASDEDLAKIKQLLESLEENDEVK